MHSHLKEMLRKCLKGFRDERSVEVGQPILDRIGKLQWPSTHDFGLAGQRMTRAGSCSLFLATGRASMSQIICGLARYACSNRGQGFEFHGLCNHRF